MRRTGISGRKVRVLYSNRKRIRGNQQGRTCEKIVEVIPVPPPPVMGRN